MRIKSPVLEHDVKSVITVALFPASDGPVFCSSVYVQYNTQKQKSGEKHGRPGNTYHVNDIWWTRGEHGGKGHIQIAYSTSSSSAPMIAIASYPGHVGGGKSGLVYLLTLVHVLFAPI